MAWSEARMHRWLALQGVPPQLRGSPGHDAAVLAPSRGRMVLCVDQCVLGVHALNSVSPVLFGRKAAARCLSDLAATAAHPRALVLALHAPAAFDERWLRACVRAVRAEAQRHGADLVGGDLACCAGPLCATVSALGELRSKRRPVGRDRALPGDRVLLTGAVGGSLLGRHLRIEPRLAAGRLLAGAGARALIDVSDGLALDLTRLALASEVAIDLEHLPIHRDAVRRARQTGLSAEHHALWDGEDHELIACLPPRSAAAVIAREPGWFEVGRVRRGRGLRWHGQSLDRQAFERGWVHGHE